MMQKQHKTFKEGPKKQISGCSVDASFKRKANNLLQHCSNESSNAFEWLQGLKGKSKFLFLT